MSGGGGANIRASTRQVSGGRAACGLFSRRVVVLTGRVVNLMDRTVALIHVRSSVRRPDICSSRTPAHTPERYIRYTTRYTCAEKLIASLIQHTEPKKPRKVTKKTETANEICSVKPMPMKSPCSQSSGTENSRHLTVRCQLFSFPRY